MAQSVRVVGSLNAAEATGGAVELAMQGFVYVAFQLQGTFTATVTFYGSCDGLNWTAMSVLPLGTATAVTTSTTEGIWVSTRPTPLSHVKAAITSYSSGPVNITITAAS